MALIVAIVVKVAKVETVCTNIFDLITNREIHSVNIPAVKNTARYNIMLAKLVNSINHYFIFFGISHFTKIFYLNIWKRATN